MTAKETLTVLLSKLQQYVLELERLSKFPPEAFLADSDKLGNAKYHLVIAIECVIDITHHLLAEYRLRRPDDYSDAIRVLEEEKLISASLSQNLQAMIRFRNLLVHMYGKVDDRRVYEYLRSNLTDFNEFAKAIAGLGGE